MWSERSFEELPFLVAEDSEDDLILLERAIQQAGIHNPCIVAGSGVEAIEYLSASLHDPTLEHRFPVIMFLDLLMPRMDGIEVLHWLKDTPHPPLAVVLHTGVESEDMLSEARDLGATFYLPKGSRPEALKEVFQRAKEEWEQSQLVH